MKKINLTLIFLLIIFEISCSPKKESVLVCGTLSMVFDQGLETRLVSYSYDKSIGRTKLSGIVFDELTIEPLIGVDITLLPCSINTCTDINGYFTFEYQNFNCDSLVIKYVAYREKRLDIRELIEDYINNKNK